MVIFNQKSMELLVLGLSDGILTALVLASSSLIDPTEHISLDFAFRLALVSLASGAFVYFVASYSKLRGSLIRAEREINLTSRGHMATTNLGRAVLRDALRDSTVTSLASGIGTLVPLLTGAILPAYRWAAILSAVVVLGLLGIGLSRAFSGSAWRWSVSLMIGGLLLSWIGVELHIT